MHTILMLMYIFCSVTVVSNRVIPSMCGQARRLIIRPSAMRADMDTTAVSSSDVVLPVRPKSALSEFGQSLDFRVKAEYSLIQDELIAADQRRDVLMTMVCVSNYLLYCEVVCVSVIITFVIISSSNGKIEMIIIFL